LSKTNLICEQCLAACQTVNELSANSSVWLISSFSSTSSYSSNSQMTQNLISNVQISAAVLMERQTDR